MSEWHRIKDGEFPKKSSVCLVRNDDYFPYNTIKASYIPETKSFLLSHGGTLPLNLPVHLPIEITHWLEIPEFACDRGKQDDV